MPLRSLAFGPLPKAQVQASQRIGQSQPSGGPSLSGLGSSGGQDQGYDAAMTVGGPQREPEAFSPVFPDLYEANLADLPGGQGSAPDFNSETAQTLANPPKGTGVSFPTPSSPDAWRTDLDAAFKSLKGLNQAVRAIEGPSQPPTQPQGADLDSLTRTAGGDAFSAGQPGSQVSGGELGGLEAGGFEPDLGGAAGGGGGPTIGPGLGSLTSLYGLGTAAATGNPIGIAQGALNSYNAITGLVGQIGSSTVAPISSAIVSAAPEIAAAIAESAGVATAGMTAAQLTNALSGALAAWGGAAAPIIQGIVEYINNAEQMRMRDAGWRNNPIKGAMYSNATAGVGQANKLFGGLGDLTTASSQDLLGALTGGTNSLLPYFATAQGGRGAIRASDTVTGKNQGPTSNAQPYTGDGASPAGYTQNFTTARDQLANVVNELMRRGATYEELGQVPVSGNWASESLDAAGTPDEYLMKSPRAGQFAQEGNALFGSLGLSPTAQSAPAGGEGGGWQQEATKTQPDQLAELLKQSLGASMQGADKDTNASGLMTGMYGGPLWTALARMGVGGTLGDLIAQKFDPWVNARTWAPGSRRPQGGAAPSGMTPAQYESFTSGGM